MNLTRDFMAGYLAGAKLTHAKLDAMEIGCAYRITVATGARFDLIPIPTNVGSRCVYRYVFLDPEAILNKEYHAVGADMLVVTVAYVLALAGLNPQEISIECTGEGQDIADSQKADLLGLH